MIILDTNVLSEVTRQAPDSSVLAWMDAVRVEELATTAITVAELLYGVTRLPDGNRKSSLTAAVHGLMTDDFQGRIETFDMSAAVQYSAVVHEREALGRPISTADAQIAAICRAREATLATRNIKDFEDTGIELLNPWHGC